MLGLIGKKLGMTRIFTEVGESIPVTVLDISGNRVVQIKTDERDGYCAVQVAFGERRTSRITKPMAGHLAKHKAGPASVLKEFRLEPGEDSGLEPGAPLNAEAIFQEGQLVDVSGVTSGKGFAGGIKRHGFRANRASHGNSRAHRKQGSTGPGQDPGRVWPGRKMPGHMGNRQRTTQRLPVVKIDGERGILLVRGSVPGTPSGNIVVRPSRKIRGSAAK